MGALLTLIGSVVAVPWFLIAAIGWPLPRQIPSPGDISDWLTSPMDDQAIFRIIACVIWALWLIWVSSLIVAGYDLARNAGSARPAPTGIQALAAALLTAVTLNVLGAASYAQPPPTPQVVATTMQLPGLAEPVAHTEQPLSSERSLDEPEALAVLLERDVDPSAGRRGEGTSIRRLTVQKYDNLWDLADTYLGSGDRWKEIYVANHGLVQADGQALTDPRILQPGWVLILPAEPPTSEAPPPSANPPASPAPDHESPRPEPSASSPASRRPTLPPPAAGHAPTRPVPAESTVSPSAQAGSGSPTHRPTAAPAHSAGVELPGGWVTAALAAALTLIGGLVWRQRRRRYRVEPLPGPDPAASDLRPLPAQIGILRAGVQAIDGELLQPRDPGPTVTEAARTVDVTLPPPGPDGAGLAGLPEPITPSGLGLTGDGASAAIRALLVATLTAGGPDDPDAAGTVLIAAGTLAELLGAAAVDLPNQPRLQITTDLPAALTALEDLLIARRRELDEQGMDDLGGPDAIDPYRPPMPLVLLIAEAPAPAQHARVSAALQLGAPLRFAGVFLGDWPSGDTLEVYADGATGQGPADPDNIQRDRLSVLDVATTLTFLDVVREAHTGAAASASASETVIPAAALIPASEDLPPAEPDEGVRTPSTPTRPFIRTLGGRPAILGADREPVIGVRAASLELLGLLVAHRKGLDLPDIMEIFYPDATVRRASERLSTNVSQLRQRIRTAAGQPDNRKLNPVLNTGSHYQLDPAIVSVDWWDMQDAMAEARAAEGPARQEALERAIATWTGPLLDGCDYHWAETHREYSRRQAITAHTELAALPAAADPDRAAALLEAAGNIDPLNEEVARLAISAHAQRGNLKAARERFRQLSAALQDIDAEPDAATIGLIDEFDHLP
ncbi:BTAD domain-containing putative transcriptional regulator [Cryptosporangium phraense]|uniref:BTAD domain-containing putative transcriptional regulator n=1 Tax=Cryptosporangium phraense TaxID=2593070 RepID=UPI0014791DD0|nr:BTAD domain-containing putative transcriptional regulator [Cryptosporangium phraense]